MIRSSADIAHILGGSPVIRISAQISIVEKKPLASGREGLFIYIEKYPTIDEFEATWSVWIESDGSEPDDLVFEELKRLLPNFEYKLGLIIEGSTTDFKTESTEEKPKPVKIPEVAPPTGWMSQVNKRLEEFHQDIQDRMLLVSGRMGPAGQDGKDGRDGLPGAPGRDGRDGKDMLATEAYLDDLKDVGIQSKIPLQKGQVLTYDGVEWTNLFVPQLLSTSGGGGGGESSTVTPSPGTGIQWRYHSRTNETEPDPKDFHADNDSAELITLFHVSKTSYHGNDVELLTRELLDLSTRIYIEDRSNPSIHHLYTIDSYVETTGGYEISVTHVDTAGTEVDFVQPDVYTFTFLGAQVPADEVPSTIDDLDDVDTSTVVPTVGQTLVWDGVNWVPGDGSEGIGEAPIDGHFYVRQNGQWIKLEDALAHLAIGDGGQFSPFGDGGNFTTGYAGTAYDGIIDGSDLTGNTTDAPDDESYDGGYWS